MGIRRKIALGFVCLGVLLFFSGLVSYFELSRLRQSTNTMLENSVRNIEFSKKMLDAVQEQNTALLQIMVLGNQGFDSLLIAGSKKFEDAIKSTELYVYDLPGLDSIYAAGRQYNHIVLDHLADTATREERIEWFVNTYRTSYYELTTTIKNFMINSQNVMDKKAESLHSNAYRAIMPSIIALIIGIIIILIFYYFIDIYYTKPVINITEGLKGFLSNGIPFKAKVEGRDEILSLRDYIEQLIIMAKSKKS